MARCPSNVVQRLRQRQVCESLDEVTLATIADHEIERAIIEYVDGRLSCRGQDEEQVGILNALPPGVRALYLTWTVESEVINGGFVRYFRNRAAQFAQDAVAAFEFFSAHEHARLMREANRVHTQECGTTHVSDGRELVVANESWRQQLLEDNFHHIDESLSALRIGKIRSDPRAFCEG